MSPNKGTRSIDQAHHIEGLVSLVRPESDAAYQKRMSADAQEEDCSQSRETDRAPTSAEVECEDRFLDF